MFTFIPLQIFDSVKFALEFIRTGSHVVNVDKKYINATITGNSIR